MNRNMQITEVINGTTAAQEFLIVPVRMNRENPHFIRALDNEVNDVFDPAKNKTYQYGETKRWIAKNEAGQLIGRIAAFTNTKYVNKGTEFPVGGV
ncbi:MAG TPA: hypothetical protein VG842_12180, partial [Sediminibacterium sp.]|nr:hypothetical protein [Sediminibacterium sp.]